MSYNQKIKNLLKDSSYCDLVHGVELSEDLKLFLTKVIKNRKDESCNIINKFEIKMDRNVVSTGSYYKNSNRLRIEWICI